MTTTPDVSAVAKIERRTWNAWVDAQAKSERALRTYEAISEERFSEEDFECLHVMKTEEQTKADWVKFCDAKAEEANAEELWLEARAWLDLVVRLTERASKDN